MNNAHKERFLYDIEEFCQRVVKKHFSGWDIDYLPLMSGENYQRALIHIYNATHTLMYNIPVFSSTSLTRPIIDDYDSLSFDEGGFYEFLWRHTILDHADF